MTSSTNFSLTAYDNESGVNHTYYRVWFNGLWTQWIEYIEAFTLNDECTHYLEYYSVDNVGNIESIHNQTHYLYYS